MKKLTCLLLLLLSSIISYSQHTTVPETGFTIADVYVAKKGGKWTEPETTIAQLMEHPALEINGFKVTGFTISILPPKGKYLGPFFIEGAQIPGNLLEQLKAFDGLGGRVLFENVKATRADGKVCELGAFVLKCLM